VGELPPGGWNDKQNKIELRFRILIAFFIFTLTVSGLTAIPLQQELKVIMSLFGDNSILGSMFPALASWLGRINEGVQNGYGQYPFLAYGTDWLAFGHIVIASHLLVHCATL